MAHATDPGDRIEERLDAKGERVERAFDRAAARAFAQGRVREARRLRLQGDIQARKLRAAGDRIDDRLDRARAARFARISDRRDLGDRIEDRLDRQGARVERAFDRAAARAAADGRFREARRLRVKGDLANRRLQAQGDRIDDRLDRGRAARFGRRDLGDRIEDRLDRKGARVERAFDRAARRAAADGRFREARKLRFKGDVAERKFRAAGNRIDDRLDRKARSRFHRY